MSNILDANDSYGFDTHAAKQDGISSTAKPSPWAQQKRISDFVIALVLFIPVAPLIGILIVLVRLTSRGPGIFRQVRVGLDGRNYTMYKLRSMTSDAEKNGPVWAKQNDSRVTWLGNILRKTHLDELPQLLNVLKGEMSFVGPRPERPEFVEVLAEEIPGYKNRLTVRPGITGLAQVNLPPDENVDSVRRKLVLDLEYNRTANLWLDFRLIICTSVKVLGVSTRHVRRFLKVNRTVRIIESDRNPIAEIALESFSTIPLEGSSPDQDTIDDHFADHQEQAEVLQSIRKPR